MDDEPQKQPTSHRLGDDLSRHSVAELEALRAALMEEVARVEAERASKDAKRSAADSFFNFKG